MDEEIVRYGGQTVGRTWVAPRGLYQGRRFVTTLTGHTEILAEGADRQDAREWLFQDYTRPFLAYDASRAVEVLEEMVSVDTDHEQVEAARAALAARTLIAISRGTDDPARLASIVLDAYTLNL